jgi:hypothetical protein
MYKILIVPVLLFLTLSSMAQKASIKGRVTDSLNNTPVELATVAVLNARDTTVASLITYFQTPKDGVYKLSTLPVGVPLKVVISFVGYKPAIKFFTLIKGQTLDMGNVRLSSRQLDEVSIKAERMPIVIRKDTIEFDATAFKTRPNAVVEDLLKKLPGVEVDNQGKITVLGKDVKKILVDGREFFASDPRIATKNLDADMIAKVQVYDDREDDPNHIIPDNEVNKIINLKFKKALKKSTFGKMYGGMGTQDHYQAGGLINTFRDTLQVSALGYTNNLNSTGFDYNDLYNNGGVSRGGTAFSRAGGFGFSGPTGKQTATTAGININTDYGKKLQVNLSYLLNHTNTNYNTLTNRQQFLGDTTATTGSISNRMNVVNTHNLSGSVAWRPNDATQLKYSPLMTITATNATSDYSSNSFSNFINPINNSVSSNNSSGNVFQFQHSLNYNHQLKKEGASFNIDHSFSYNPGSSIGFDNQDLTSYATTLPSYSYRQRGDNNSKNINGNLGASYRTPITKKLSVDIGTTAEYSDQLDKVSTYDYNPVTGQYDSFLLEKSSDLTRNRWSQTVNPGFTYALPKGINLVAHLNAQWQQVNNIFNRNTPELDQHYFSLLPVVNINIKSFSASYSRSMQLPNIGDMVPYSVVFSPLYTVTGNPNLKPTTRDNFSLNYIKYNYQKGINVYLTGGLSFEQNTIFRERTLDADLVETSMPINRNGRYTFNVSGSLGKRFKKKNGLQFNYNTNVNTFVNHSFFVLNHQDGFQNSSNFSFTQRFSLNWKDIVELDPQYRINFTHTTYTGIDYNTQNYVMHNIDTHFNIYLPKKMNLEGNYTYLYNPLVAPGFQKSSNLLNIALARQLLKKDRAEIKLSGYDILNQNISVSRNINENTITDSQSQIVKRYFMVTLRFKFNKSTVKEDSNKPSLGGLMIR